MANTSYYHEVDLLHWNSYGSSSSSLSLTASASVVAPVVLQQASISPSIFALATAWSLSTFLPKPQGKLHLKYQLLQCASGMALVLNILTWVTSHDVISVNGVVTSFLPTLSGSVAWQTLQLIRLTMSAWFLTHLFELPNIPNHEQQGKGKSSVSQHSKLYTETEFTLDVINKMIDKFIVFTVLLASIMLFLGSVLYLAVASTFSWLSSCYKGISAHILEPYVSVLSFSLMQQHYHLTRQLLFLVSAGLLAHACLPHRF